MLQSLHPALALVQAGRTADAADICRQILSREPDNPVVLHLLGVLSAQLGPLPPAIAYVQQAIALAPTNGEYHSNLAKLLLDAGRIDEAIAEGRLALQLWPDAAPAINLAAALERGGQSAQAIDVLHAAAQRAPANVHLIELLGHALRHAQRHVEAEQCFQEVLNRVPDHVPALNNLGLMLHLRGESDAALALLEKAVALQPRLVEGYINLRGVHRERGELDAALRCQRQAMELAPADPSLHSDLILTLLYHPGTTPETLRHELAAWWQNFGAPVAHELPPPRNDRSSERRLRLAYISGDFRDHVVGRTMRHLLRAHDRSRLEVFCYADVEYPDALTAEFRALADTYRDIRGMADAAIAALIRSDHIDILVDLSLHTARNHLPVLARRPAPVQATFAGYPGTTGLPTVDYRLSDPYLDPPPTPLPPGGDESLYTERTLRVPDCFFFHDALENPAPPIHPLPALANGHITFGCLCNFSKVNDRVLTLWAQAMAAVPGSRLVLLTAAGAHRRRTQNFLATRGIAPERVTFFRKCPRREYLELHHRIDIALDTLPYNGHMTTLDALYMGVPVVTLVGSSVVGRAGLSILTNLGLPDLIAHTPDSFIDITRTLALDLPRLTRLRATLRQRLHDSPLMDAPRMSAALAGAYLFMWRTWCAST